jgi:16S rRNA processing protein RimM
MDLLEVGRVARPHGLRGEVVVTLVTNRLERLAPGSRLSASRVAVAPEDELVVVAAHPHGGRYLVRFAGVDTIEAAERLRDVVLFAPAVEDPDELFVHDLVGREVRETSGVTRGRITAVQANPASDLLVLEDGHLVPIRFVTDVEGDVVLIEVPDGLFE